MSRVLPSRSITSIIAHNYVGVVPNSLQDIGRASDGAERRSVAGGLGRSVAVRYGIYTLARVSWRLDSLVSRHRRVTQNSR